MKLQIGHKYQYWYVRTWIYEGLIDGDHSCDDCGKMRKRLHWFHAEDNPNDLLRLGTECVKEMTPIAP